jgi:ketopantoate reductase
LGFPGASGSREDGVVKYLLISQQPTMLGEIEGLPRSRVQQIAEMLREAGFRVTISENMDAWLKTHAVFVTAVCGALYCVGGDNYRLARSTETFTRFADGVREGLRCSERSVFHPRRSICERFLRGCRVPSRSFAGDVFSVPRKASIPSPNIHGLPGPR